MRTWSIARRFPDSKAVDAADRSIFGGSGNLVGLVPAAPGRTLGELLDAWLTAYRANGGRIVQRGWGNE